MDFTQTLQAHLQAISTRDLDGFLATVSDEATIILPTGVQISGQGLVQEFHSVWFSDPDWTISFKTLRVIEGSELAFALLEVDYHDLDASGQPYDKRYYLSLLFAASNGTWLLQHDQNTFMSGM